MSRPRPILMTQPVSRLTSLSWSVEENSKTNSIFRLFKLIFSSSSFASCSFSLESRLVRSLMKERFSHFLQESSQSLRKFTIWWWALMYGSSTVIRCTLSSRNLPNIDSYEYPVELTSILICSWYFPFSFSLSIICWTFSVLLRYSSAFCLYLFFFSLSRYTRRSSLIPLKNRRMQFDRFRT